MSTEAREPRVGATRDAIQAHYDINNEFYALWLGSTMAYSGAMWAEGDDLDAAQLRKIDHHIRESGADRAARVLDIGCGWGGLLGRLVDAHRPEEVVGLTLSEAQAAWIRGRALPKVTVRVESWADYAPDATFQAIISIGAFEHFARLDFSEEEKIAAYRQFFARCAELLDEGGLLSLQTFAYGSRRPRQAAVDAEATRFLAAEIFQETDPPTLANIATAIQGTFELRRMHNDREGYARTCRVWLENLKARREDALRLVGPEVYERYRKYLYYSFAGFTSGNLDLYRITLRRLPASAGTSKGRAQGQAPGQAQGQAQGQAHAG